MKATIRNLIQQELTALCDELQQRDPCVPTRLELNNRIHQHIDEQIKALISEGAICERGETFNGFKLLAPPHIMLRQQRADYKVINKNLK